MAAGRQRNSADTSSVMEPDSITCGASLRAPDDGLDVDELADAFVVSEHSICFRSSNLQSPLRRCWLPSCPNAPDFRPVSTAADFCRRLVGSAAAGYQRL